jgi:DNA polymerase III epsilon subunit-like protein
MFCVVDLETTSNNVTNAQIITGTFLAVDEKLNLIAEKRIQCKPWRWDDDAVQASRIHGITKEMTDKWQSFNSILPSLFDWFGMYNFRHFVCHAKRDMYGKKTTYDHAVIRLNLFPSDYYWKFVNTFNERNIISTHSLASYLDSSYNFPKKDLKSIATTLGIKLDNHHDDRADAIACYEIFKTLYPKVSMSDFVNWDFYKLEVSNEDNSRTSVRHSKRSGELKAFN